MECKGIPTGGKSASFPSDSWWVSFHPSLDLVFAFVCIYIIYIYMCEAKIKLGHGVLNFMEELRIELGSFYLVRTAPPARENCTGKAQLHCRGNVGLTSREHTYQSRWRTFSFEKIFSPRGNAKKTKFELRVTKFTRANDRAAKLRAVWEIGKWLFFFFFLLRFKLYSYPLKWSDPIFKCLSLVC